MRLVAVVAALVAAAPAAASVTIATDAERARLRVDAQGYAEVSWISRGERRYVLVPPRGRALPGARLPGRDVSVTTTAVRIPYRQALRRTPDGRYWALQAWQVGFRGPIELRFSRWRGAPTKVTLEVRERGPAEVLVGKATFHGRPVYGTSPTLEGDRISLAAAIDCFGCAAARGRHWFRVTAVKTRPDGRFGATIARAWSAPKYRVSVAGPNAGTTLAPDAAAVVRG